MTTYRFALTEDQFAIQHIVRNITARWLSGDADRSSTSVIPALG